MPPIELITAPAETESWIRVYGNDNRYHFRFRSKIGRLVNRRLLALPAAVAVVTVGLTACSSSDDSPGVASSGSSPSAAAAAAIKVVASTNVWGDLAKSVGGDKVEVTSIINSPDADPHEYEASTRNQLALKSATLVIENGGGYDDFMDRMLKGANNSSATVLNAVTISGHKAAAGETLNEHVWYDFPTVTKVVDQLQQTYTKADPQDTSTFQQNADALEQKIDGLVQQEAALKQKYDGQPVAITEPVPVYLLDAVGLQNKTPDAFSEAIEEDSDVPAKVLSDTLALYSSHQVKVLAYNAQTTGPETEKVLAAAKQNNIPVVPVTETLPSGKDYVGWMSANLGALGAALGQ
jgi:zinc/manganese transport system substrate-binding protein